MDKILRVWCCKNIAQICDRVQVLMESDSFVKRVSFFNRINNATMTTDYLVIALFIAQFKVFSAFNMNVFLFEKIQDIAFYDSIHRITMEGSIDSIKIINRYYTADDFFVQ